MKKLMLLNANTSDKTGEWFQVEEDVKLISIHLYAKIGRSGAPEPEIGVFDGKFVVEQSHFNTDDVQGAKVLEYNGNDPATILQTGIRAPFIRVRCIDWRTSSSNYYYVSACFYK